MVAYREHRDAFATFGSAVRQEAAAHGWSYDVVGGDDEGMLLYLRRTEFLEPDQAAAEWNSGKLDGLVLPEDEVGRVASRVCRELCLQDRTVGPAGRTEALLFWCGYE